MFFIRPERGRGSEERGDQGAQKGFEPSEEKAEIVAGGGENGVGAVAVAALEVIAVRAMLGLDVADHRLDGGWAPHLAAEAR